MKCLNCDGEKFKEKQLRFSPEVKGEEIEVVVPTFTCGSCDQPLMDTTQMNRLRKSAADAYRAKHGLLASDEIVRFRTNLGMSQVQFAKHLGVGEASIKRWETYYVQDLIQDEHIKLKCDESYADKNALQVHWAAHSDEFSGNKKFNLERFENAVLYLAPVAKSPLFLNKALFYADFKHFQKHGVSITGNRYVHLEYGPCPDQFQNLFKLLIDNKLLSAAGKHTLVRKHEPDMSVFDDNEKETLAYIYDQAKKDDSQSLLDLSHEEDGFKKTSPCESISYKYAKTLKV